ncbi:hypothetical protein JGI3_02261 [Candidatus Kryptobacter tengchongensis]|nr:hypothetical protein JGI3_02261 [Candidatus Kryptobacter tengchongensis]
MKKLLLTFILLTEIAFPQENRWSFEVSWEFYSYYAYINPHFKEKFKDLPEMESLKMFNYELSFISLGKPILLMFTLGGNGKNVKSDFSTSANFFASLSIGFGTRRIGIYGTGKLKVWFDLKQKAVDCSGAEKWASFKNFNSIVFYSVGGGIMMIWGDVILFRIEGDFNLWPFKELTKLEAPDLIPAFNRLTMAEYSFKFGIGLAFKIK